MSYSSPTADYGLLGVLRNVSLNAGAPADLGSIMVGAQAYSNVTMLVVSTSAAGTLAAATLGLFAAPGGASQVVAATALTNLTAGSLTQLVAGSSTSVLNSPSLYVRSTVASLNAGTADVYVFGYVWQP